jgi:hypothetical protein
LARSCEDSFRIKGGVFDREATEGS